MATVPLSSERTLFARVGYLFAPAVGVGYLFLIAVLTFADWKTRWIASRSSRRKNEHPERQVCER